MYCKLLKTISIRKLTPYFTIYFVFSISIFSAYNLFVNMTFVYMTFVYMTFLLASTSLTGIEPV